MSNLGKKSGERVKKNLFGISGQMLLVVASSFVWLHVLPTRNESATQNACFQSYTALYYPETFF